LIALVRELRLEHIEAELAAERLVAFGGDKFKARVRIDEASDEPGTRHAIDVNPPPRDPRFVREIRGPVRPRFPARGDRLFAANAACEPADDAFGRVAPRRAEKVDADDFREPASQLLDFALDLGAQIGVEYAAARQQSGELAPLSRELRVLGVARRLELRL